MCKIVCNITTSVRTVADHIQEIAVVYDVAERKVTSRQVRPRRLQAWHEEKNFAQGPGTSESTTSKPTGWCDTNVHPDIHARGTASSIIRPGTDVVITMERLQGSLMRSLGVDIDIKTT
jgi:hypothetical protein